MPWIKKAYNMGDCKVSQCGVAIKCCGYCEKHYRRWKAHGDPAIKLRADNGKGHLDKLGYIRVPNPHTKGQTFQHRLVMEAKLGRQLKEHETVHHVNGIKHDNRPHDMTCRYCGLSSLEIHSYELVCSRKLLNDNATAEAGTVQAGLANTARVVEHNL